MKDIHGGRNVDESRFPSDTRRRRLGPWLRALAGTCLAAAMAGGLTIVAGDIAAGASPSPRAARAMLRAVRQGGRVQVLPDG